jgi:hypothetical protein
MTAGNLQDRGPSHGRRARHRRPWWLVAAGAVVLLVAGAVLGPMVSDRVRYGAVYPADRLAVRVPAGARFSLAVTDRGASVGDRWEVTGPPGANVTFVRSELVMESLHDRLFGPAPGGGGGTRYFTYDARTAGHTTITLHNCFQGCDHPSRQALSSTLTWDVTVG